MNCDCFRCDLKVLSDANKFFIETILKNHGVYECFSEIITNPTFVDKEGRLRIFPYHGSTLPPHGCDLCPPNLCKVPKLLNQQLSILFPSDLKLINRG